MTDRWTDGILISILRISIAVVMCDKTTTRLVLTERLFHASSINLGGGTDVYYLGGGTDVYVAQNITLHTLGQLCWTALVTETTHKMT